MKSLVPRFSQLGPKKMTSLVESVKRKYDEIENCEIPGIIITGSPGKTGSGKLCLPCVLIMDCQKIQSAGDVGELKDLAGGIQELDLTNNLFDSWDEVIRLLECLPNLASLNLAHNPLHKAPTPVDLAFTPGCLPPSSPITPLSFPSLTTLVLNSTKVSWEHIIPVMDLLPNLNCLYLCLNDSDQVAPHLEDLGSSNSDSLSSLNSCCSSTSPSGDRASTPVIPHLSSSPKSYPNLRSLYYNQNKVSQWSQVLRLGHLFPNLETLIMIDNLISEIPCVGGNNNNNTSRMSESSDDLECDEGSVSSSGYDSGEIASWSGLFPRLNMLNFSHNLIDDWNSVENLCGFPALTDLKILGLPLYKDWSEEKCRHYVIAILPQLARLNGSKIDREEKDTAERAFLRHFQDLPDYQKTNRYRELELVHGKLDPLAEVDLSPQHKVNLLVRLGEASRHFVLDVRHTVGHVKRLCCALFDLPRPSLVRMLYGYYVDEEAKLDELHYPNRVMHAYKPEDGDEIHLILKT